METRRLVMSDDDQDDMMNADGDEGGGLGIEEGDGFEDGYFDAPLAPREESSESKAEGGSGPKVDVPVQPKKRTPKMTKRARKPLTAQQKAIRLIVRKAAVDKLPSIDHILRGKVGTSRLEIKDIALFIEPPTDEFLAEIGKECLVKNIVNLSAPVVKSRVITIGAQIIAAGRMYQPILVARVDGTYQCTSGRHRLAFLALMYGTSTSIPVYIEDMSLNEARDAVVVANQSRPTKALERAEHAVLQAVGGNVDAKQDELFTKTVITKAKAKKYCVYSVLERGYPTMLSFPVSLTASRRDGGLTTLTNVENYWGASIEWHKDMNREEFDAALESATEFLNAIAKAMEVNEDFKPASHMAAMPLSAIGKYYRTYKEITGESPIGKVSDVASAIVEMGDIGRQNYEQTYEALAQVMRGR
jgi:hypothetical protein